MLKAYKFRLVPNMKQSIVLNKTFGCVRYFWNKQVEQFNSYNKETNSIIRFKSSTEIRNENEWMKEVSAAAIQQKEIDFKDFKKQRFSASRKKKIGNPSFKKRNGRQSFRLPNQKFTLLETHIRLEKTGKVKIVKDRELPTDCKFMSVTVSMDCDGKYFASILVETEIKHFEKTGKTIGIDVGIKGLGTLSDGTVIENPKWFRNSQAKLKRMQRRFSKKKKGSSRRKKCKLKIARLQKKTANQRGWYLQNLSSKIVKDFDLVSIEDLNVSGMIKNRKLSKSIADCSFAKFFSMLDYKCKWYGKDLVKIPRFAPTSKTCSSCGNVKKELKLSERTYKCDTCGHEMNRDLNASININAMGVDIAKRA